MPNFQWFYRKILEHLLDKTDAYQNLFMPRSHFLYYLLKKEPTQQEIVLAQKAFQKLKEEGLIYDTNGDGWYTITDEGKSVLKKEATLTLNDDIKILLKNYEFHPKIKNVSSKLVNDGHYKEAIQNALVEVIDRVKEIAEHPKDRLGKELDGDTLMNTAFGCDGDKIPLIKLNPLANSLDMAEQRGFMYLFKGIVGIRDKKAHLNFIQNDPYKAIEYLSLASLLMRLLENNFLKKF